MVGNHTCGNRGDSAILRGLVTALEQLDNNIDITITSRFPESSSYLFGRELIPDTLYNTRNSKINGKLKNKFKKIRAILDITILESKVSNEGIFRFLPLSPYLNRYIEGLNKYDAVIQVGGSFFVDVYGFYQFEHALSALCAKKPLLILGHSVGPFSGFIFKKVSNTVFNKATFFGLRESISLQLIKDQLDIHNDIYLGTDMAWLVSNTLKADEERSHQAPKIAITVRSLSPFDIKLKVSQTDYEERMAKICLILIEKGYHIVAVSTCTGIDGYNKDDRIVALRIKKLCGNNENFEVLMNEYNDIELGNIFSQCILTIGTRLHSAIISMNFGTPAFALNYEHKSEGIMKNMGMSNLSISFDELMSKKFDDKILDILKDIDNIKLITQERVKEEKVKALNLIKQALKKL